MMATNIVEVTAAVQYWRSKVGCNPTRIDICVAFRAQNSVNKDITEAISHGCIQEDPSTKELMVTQEGDDLITGRVYSAKEIFGAKEEAK